mmetsp:Transcript_19523/g.53635  ORF Transcript_19523/g.53635 Transcript_19523/m.53635 type:complete len:208 (+) Transcript_19523:515-1138(+)
MGAEELPLHLELRLLLNTDHKLALGFRKALWPAVPPCLLPSCTSVRTAGVRCLSLPLSVPTVASPIPSGTTPCTTGIRRLFLPPSMASVTGLPRAAAPPRPGGPATSRGRCRRRCRVAGRRWAGAISAPLFCGGPTVPRLGDLGSGLWRCSGGRGRPRFGRRGAASLLHGLWQAANPGRGLLVVRVLQVCPACPRGRVLLDEALRCL